MDFGIGAERMVRRAMMLKRCGFPLRGFELSMYCGPRGVLVKDVVKRTGGGFRW